MFRAACIYIYLQRLLCDGEIFYLWIENTIYPSRYRFLQNFSEIGIEAVVNQWAAKLQHNEDMTWILLCWAYLRYYIQDDICVFSYFSKLRCPRGRQETVYAAKSILWFIMVWWRKEPWHRQPWYWLGCPSSFSSKRGYIETSSLSSW